VHLFETCHRRVWTKCKDAIDAAEGPDGKLAAYVGQILELVDEHPEVIAFLSENGRVLWPKTGPAARRHTMIGLARSLMTLGRRPRRGARLDPDVMAASLQGTLAELMRMVHVGVIPGPAVRWKTKLVALFRRVAA